ncbi:MAG TPA: lipoprotein, partial [Steroidobacteraceae bacterium]|nr:lipoprotein [Steroidobacteraceae bacterium]
RRRAAGYTGAMKLLYVAAATLPLLSACGQRGPLVLPDHGARPAVAAPARAPASAPASTAGDPRNP